MCVNVTAIIRTAFISAIASLRGGGARLFIAILDVLHFECVGTVQDEVSNSVKELDFDHFAVHYEFVRFSQIALLQLLHHK